MPSTISHTAKAREGMRFLLVSGTGVNSDAYVHDVATGKKTKPQPLQVWFKWANWEACKDADYRAVLGAAND